MVSEFEELLQLADRELATLVTRLSEELARRQQARRLEFLSKIRAQAEELGIGSQELAAAFGENRHGVEAPAAKKKKRAGGAGRRNSVIYKNPANPDETWCGRGRRPRWVQKLIATGQSPLIGS